MSERERERKAGSSFLNKLQEKKGDSTGHNTAHSHIPVNIPKELVGMGYIVSHDFQSHLLTP